MSRYKETTGYIIHQRAFKDSSLILEFFCQDNGKMQLIAKGIKKNKKLRSQVQYFSLIKVQYFGKSQLKTVSALNIINQISHKNLIEKTAGLYLNELLHHSLVENDSADNIYQCYQYVISQLGKEKLTPLLRLFEKNLLKYNGFELNIESYEAPEIWLTIKDDFGLMAATNGSEKLCQVSDLKNYLVGNKLDRQSQKRVNKLMYNAINMSLNHRKLYARELLKFVTTNV